jgi:hypothetical protein
MRSIAHYHRNRFLQKALLVAAVLSVSSIALACALAPISSSNPSSASATEKSAKPAAKPSPDLLIFANGDQLTGQLERGVGNSIIFDLAGQGEVAAFGWQLCGVAEELPGQ